MRFWFRIQERGFPFAADNILQNLINFYADRDGSNSKLHRSTKFLHGSIRVDEGLFMIWYGWMTFSDELIRIFKNFFWTYIDR